MYNSFGVVFFWRIFLHLVGGLKQWFCKNITVKEGLIAKIICMIICNARHSQNKFGSALTYANIVTEKNNRRVDCAEADKKTVQAQRYEGREFLVAGDFALRSCLQLTYRRSLTAFVCSLKTLVHWQ
jgi:hypothetical protein